MACAWDGTVAELRQLLKNGSLLEKVTEGYRSNFGLESTDTERASWLQSIPALLEILDDPAFDDLQVIIELQMPVGAERADVVLIGGASDARKGLIVELKQWSSVSVMTDTREVEVGGIGLQQHPSIQALNYKGKLHFFNAAMHSYDLKAVVFLHNADARDKEQLTNVAPDWVAEAPIFTGEPSDREELTDLIRAHLLPCHLPPDEHRHVCQAPYRQSRHLFDLIRAHGQQIAQNAEKALATTGMGLTAQQARIKNDVLRALDAGEEKTFIVQGAPGSGKTLLAVSLLLKALERGKKTILALRNNRLQAVLRQVLDEVYPGASGCMMYFEPRRGVGIAQYSGRVDFLIVDEGQRMEKRIMPQVLQKAPLSVIFLDETQRLNPPEQGTIQNFRETAESLGRKPQVYSLPAMVRCSGGEPYQQWVEMLLSEPERHEELRLSGQTWREHYSFAVCASIEELLERLITLRSQANRVALVASFTESPGNYSGVSHPDNLRIGYPLTSGFDLYKNSNITIPWLMKPNEYKAYWLGGQSNKLEKVASIYGAQGFESDYVGVVWGRDLVYRNGKWQLGDPNICYDRIDGLITGRRGNHRWSGGALDLVLNRYRIFLTRGIKGTFLFCEDEETRNYFSSLATNH